MKLIFPVNEIAITQGYHSGYAIDLGTISGHEKNSPVLSCADGIVYEIQRQPLGGNVLFILHNNGWLSCYAHLKEVNVKVNDRVKCGQEVGIKGNTGKKWSEELHKYVKIAVHLHFGIWKNKKYINKKTKSAMIPILDYMFVGEEQIVSKTTNSKYDLLKYGETRTCTASTLRIRKAPSLTAKQVSTIKKGDKVKIYEYENGFYKLSAENNLWAYAQYLK